MSKLIFVSAILKKQNSCHNGFENPPRRRLFENKMAATKRDSPDNPNGNQLIFLSCHFKTKSIVHVHDRVNTGFIFKSHKILFSKMAALKYHGNKTKWLPTICILSYQALSIAMLITNVNHLILNEKAWISQF